MNNNNSINLYDYTRFDKVSNISWRGNGLVEFVENYVLKHPNKEMLLSDLSNIYVLVTKMYLQHQFDDEINNFPEEYLKDKKDIYVENRYEFVLGYIWVSNKKETPSKDHKWYDADIDKEIHYINIIDSRVSGLNIAKHMIGRYDGHDKYDRGSNAYYEIDLVPKHIIYDSAKYWKKYFDDYIDFGNEDHKTVLQDYMSFWKIDPENWKYLIDLY